MSNLSKPECNHLELVEVGENIGVEGEDVCLYRPASFTSSIRTIDIPGLYKSKNLYLIQGQSCESIWCDENVKKRLKSGLWSGRVPRGPPLFLHTSHQRTYVEIVVLGVPSEHFQDM